MLSKWRRKWFASELRSEQKPVLGRISLCSQLNSSIQTGRSSMMLLQLMSSSNHDLFPLHVCNGLAHHKVANGYGSCRVVGHRRVTIYQSRTFLQLCITWHVYYIKIKCHTVHKFLFLANHMIRLVARYMPCWLLVPSVASQVSSLERSLWYISGRKGRYCSPSHVQWPNVSLRFVHKLSHPMATPES